MRASGRASGPASLGPATYGMLGFTSIVRGVRQWGAIDHDGMVKTIHEGQGAGNTDQRRLHQEHARTVDTHSVFEFLFFAGGR